MQATGIIAEYNPFHNGHALHINKTKELFSQPIIVVMSGSFVQRGEPAFLDKWTRAQLAVAGGANLVIELPTCFSLRSAEHFARGSVELLAATGLVNNISCGTEHPEINFTNLAATYCKEETQSLIKKYLRDGYSYAVANVKAIGHNFASPNDILAFEYAKVCLKENIALHAIKREGADYNDTEIQTLASASAIRQAWNNRNLAEIAKSMPAFVFSTLESTMPGCNEYHIWDLIKYALATKTPEEIAAVTECSEGLENLLKNAENCSTLVEALKFCTNKRYSTSRIRRLFIQLLFNKPITQLKQEYPAYIRILAFDNKIGRELLKKMKKTANLPIINKLGKYPAANQSIAFKESIELDILATNLREIVSNADTQLNKDYTTSPYIKY